MEKRKNKKAVIIIAIIAGLALIGCLVTPVGNAIVAANAQIPTSSEFEQLIKDELQPRVSTIGEKYGIKDLEIEIDLREVSNKIKEKPTMKDKGRITAGVKASFFLKSPDFAETITKKIERSKTVNTSTNGKYTATVTTWLEELDSFYDHYADIRDEVVELLKGLWIDGEDFRIGVDDFYGGDIEYVAFKDVQNGITYGFDYTYNSSGVKLPEINGNGEKIWRATVRNYNCRECFDTGIMHYTSGGSGPCVHCNN